MGAGTTFVRAWLRDALCSPCQSSHVSFVTSHERGVQVYGLDCCIIVFLVHHSPWTCCKCDRSVCDGTHTRHTWSVCVRACARACARETDPTDRQAGRRDIRSTCMRNLCARLMSACPSVRVRPGSFMVRVRLFLSSYLIPRSCPAARAVIVYVIVLGWLHATRYPSRSSSTQSDHLHQR